MRTNLNSTSMRNTCPEFPLFGANYPDATCIDGILYDLDNVGDDGVLIKPLEEIPCPFCRTEEFIRYDPFNKEYSMDSEEDIRDWYMSYINEMRNMIMDDNRIMEAAKLIANSSAALIQAIGMMSENIERANRGESLAYTEDQFMKLIQDNGITYNNVIQRGWRL